MGNAIPQDHQDFNFEVENIEQHGDSCAVEGNPAFKECAFLHSMHVLGISEVVHHA